MSNLRVKQHPTLGIWVREDGCIYLPQSGVHPARWTFGSVNGRGYKEVCIARKHYTVHRLVAETYLPNPENKSQVDHIDRNPLNNHVSNLRWATPSENCRNRADHDRVTEQGRTHWYEDAKKAHRERQSQYYAENKDKARKCQARYYAENREKELEYQAQYRAKNKEKLREQRIQHYQDKRKTHRIVYFADGSKHWVTLEEALELLKLPLKQRVFHK